MNVAADLGRIASALEAQKADQNAEREQRDLRAQEDMALWAGRMFWAAVTTVVVSAVGIVLIFVTFRESRRAADAAETMAKEAASATKAAQEAVEVTREAAEKQLRAYVGIDRVGSQPADNTLNSDYEVLVHIKNFGVTPADDVNVQIRFADADGKALPDQSRPSRNVHFNTLPPTQVVWPTLIIPHADVRAGMAGKTTYWLVSWSYSDAFGTRHTEKVLLSAEPKQWAERFVGIASIPKK